MWVRNLILGCAVCSGLCLAPSRVQAQDPMHAVRVHYFGISGPFDTTETEGLMAEYGSSLTSFDATDQVHFFAGVGAGLNIPFADPSFEYIDLYPRGFAEVTAGSSSIHFGLGASVFIPFRVGSQSEGTRDNLAIGVGLGLTAKIACVALESLPRLTCLEFSARWAARAGAEESSEIGLGLGAYF